MVLLLISAFDMYENVAAQLIAPVSEGTRAQSIAPLQVQRLTGMQM